LDRLILINRGLLLRDAGYPRNCGSWSLSLSSRHDIPGHIGHYVAREESAARLPGKSIKHDKGPVLQRLGFVPLPAANVAPSKSDAARVRASEANILSDLFKAIGIRREIDLRVDERE
jgi:hypothetical protein